MDIVLCKISRNRCEIAGVCPAITSMYQAAFPISQILIFGTEIFMAVNTLVRIDRYTFRHELIC